MANKGSHFADFVRFRPHTYTRTQQSLPPLWVAKIFLHPNSWIAHFLIHMTLSPDVSILVVFTQTSTISKNLAPAGLIPSQLTSRPHWNFTYNNISDCATTNWKWPNSPHVITSLFTLMLSVCDCIREGSISDVSKSYFLKEFTSWKKKNTSLTQIHLSMELYYSSMIYHKIFEVVKILF